MCENCVLRPFPRRLPHLQPARWERSWRTPTPPAPSTPRLRRCRSRPAPRCAQTALPPSRTCFPLGPDCCHPSDASTSRPAMPSSAPRAAVPQVNAQAVPPAPHTVDPCPHAGTGGGQQPPRTDVGACDLHSWGTVRRTKVVRFT